MAKESGQTALFGNNLTNSHDPETCEPQFEGKVSTQRFCLYPWLVGDKGWCPAGTGFAGSWKCMSTRNVDDSRGFESCLRRGSRLVNSVTPRTRSRMWDSQVLGCKFEMSTIRSSSEIFTCEISFGHMVSASCLRLQSYQA